MLALADFEVVRDDAQIVCPVGVPLVADLLNRFSVACRSSTGSRLMYGIIARPAPHRTRARAVEARAPASSSPAATRPATSGRSSQRLPELGPNSEFLFVEGDSTRRHGGRDPARHRGASRAAAAAAQADRAAARATRCGWASPGARRGRC